MDGIKIGIYPITASNDIMCSLDDFEGHDMTVCVAVLCQNGYSVVGASDRMLSTADNQFLRPKIYHITDSIVMLIAGDLALHSELYVDLSGEVRSALQDDPSLNLNVKTIADRYSSLYAQAKLKRAERDYLSPLGLTAETFISRQSELSEKLVSTLTSELVNARMPSSSAIFAGIDESAGYKRAHIYSVQNGAPICHDDAGFAAIGIGQDHAAATLMFSAHAPDISIERAVYLAYASKKRAEVAPGVGIETDMFFAASDSGKYSLILDNVVKQLEKIYDQAEKSHRKINGDAERKCHAFIKALGDKTPAEQQQAPEVEVVNQPVAKEAGEVAEAGK